ncbi:MAG: hypothetical protein QM751_08105, partial [Paludibacteraceae bacterium]
MKDTSLIHFMKIIQFQHLKTKVKYILFTFAMLFFIGTNDAFSQISQVGTNTASSNASVTSLSVTKPTGVSVGDIMFITVAYYSSTSADVTISGWTALSAGPLSTTTTNYRSALFYKIVTTADVSASTYAITSTSNFRYVQASIIAFSGVDLNNPFDAIPNANVTTTSTVSSLSVTGITTNTNNALVVMFGMSRTSSTTPRTFSSWTTTSPGTLTEAFDNYTSSNYVSVGCATGVKSTAGTTTGNGTIALSDNAYLRGVLLALKPVTAVPDNSWIGYIYDGSAYDFSTDTYKGYYTENETFYQNFGGGDDNGYFTIASNNSTIQKSTFSVRYRMNSTKKGLYTANIVSDDGARLTVDGTNVYSYWNLHAATTHQNILMNLTGASSLMFDFYENTGENIIGFQNLTLVLDNELTTNTTQTIYIDGTQGSAISGDVFGTLPSGLSNPTYQWYYSTTQTGTQTAISGATGATFTPNTSTAPFNTVGTYYLFRYAGVTSSNAAGVTPATYTATNISNYATVTVASLTVTPISLTGFTYVEDLGPSTTQTFAVSGSSLSGTVNLTVNNSYYEISTTSTTGFGSSLTLTPTSGTLAATTIYVRLKAGLTAGNYNNQTITVSSSGFTNKTVTCSGSVTANTVGTSSVFWYKADAGTSTTTNGSGVTTWTSQTTTANTGTSQATAPTYSSTLWNFNPGVNFSTGYFLLNRGTLQDDMTFYAVYNSTQTTTSSSWWTMPAIIGNEANGTAADFGLGQNGGKLFFKGTNGDNILSTTATYNDGMPKVMSGTRKKTSSSGNNLFIYLNGTQSAAGASDNVSLTNTGDVGLGRNPTETSSQFVGGISEAIGKAYLATTTERHVFETYLAVKYGVTLTHDYKKISTNSDSLIYAIAGYNYDIAGLGRNNTLGLLQKVSSSSNLQSGSGRVVMSTDNDFTSSNLLGTRTSLVNGQYLIWGH